MDGSGHTREGEAPGLPSDRAAGALLVVIGALGAWGSAQLPIGSLQNPGPGFLPLVLSVVLITAGALVVLAGARSAPLALLRWSELRHGWGVPLAIAFAALAIERLGYRLTVALMLLFLVGVIERKPPLATLAVAAGISLGSYWLFASVLRVPLPIGVFGF